MPSFFYLKQHLKHLINAKNEYSIHSPFMFELYNNVIKKSKGNPSTLIEKLIDRFDLDNIIIIDSCYNEYKKIAPNISETTILIIKNIYSKPSAAEEFIKITNENKYVVSVNLLKLGLMFYSPKLKKQNYTLKF